MLSDSGLNCIYVISGDYATLIPDEDFHRGIEFQDPTSLVFDDLDNMIVVDRSPKLKVIDKERSYVGDIQVKFITLILDIPNLFIVYLQGDKSCPGPAQAVYLDKWSGHLYVNYRKDNIIYIYQL